jgi:hypothetical protein
MDDALPAWLKMLVSAADKLYSLFGKKGSTVIAEPSITNGLPISDASAINNILNKTASYTTNSPTITQNNMIYTSESGQAANNSLRFAFGSMASVYS